MNTEINEKLQERRLELGLTLEQVGNYVGVGKSTVRKWETGMIKDMKRSQIPRYAEILKISPLAILGLDSFDDNYCKMTGVKEIRKWTGLSQAKFAEKYHIPKRTLENWEDGKNTAPSYVLELLERCVRSDFQIKDDK